MSNKYQFKRSFFYEAKNAIEHFSVSFILGPKKCGKTVCLKQLNNAFDNSVYSVYIDMKNDFDSDDSRRAYVGNMLKSIADNSNIIYLIDEAECMAVPDKNIAKIAAAFTEYENTKTKFVFCGNPSNELEFIGHIACGGNAAFIRTDFLSYPEWLAYNGITEISEKTYVDFVLKIKDFYSCYNGIKEYLQECLDDYKAFYEKPIEYVKGVGVKELTVEMLLDVLYSSVENLYRSSFPQDTQKLSLARSITDDTHMSGHTRKTAMQFLSQCGLITLTYISDKMTVDPYIACKLLNDSNELYAIPEIFSHFKLTINYPMIFTDSANEVFRDKISDDLPPSLLKCIAESHIRSLLEKNGTFEYNDGIGKTIDYVSSKGTGTVISVTDNNVDISVFDKLPDGYKKTVLTADRDNVKNDICFVPYYRFIYENSAGKELSKRFGKPTRSE